MITGDARPFDEAIESRQAKTILPTTMRTRDLARLSPQVRERAMFSAAVTDARFLGEADGAIADLLSARVGLADARLRLDGYLRGVGYDGQLFSGDLTDLRSLARKNVHLETNLGLALGYGQWKQGQNPVTLNMWPAQELIRVERRMQEREDWEARFGAAGGTFFEGRMIGLTNSPVWETLSRFGYPYPPFDFNSGMGLRAVDRETAIAAGLLDEDEDMIPETRGLDEETSLPLPVRSRRLKETIAEQLAGIARFDGDTLVKIAPDLARNAAAMGLPAVRDIRAPKADPGTIPSRDAVARMQAGIDVTDATGETVRIDSETMAHWKYRPDELARQGYLDRAIDTLQDPVEVWDQGTQRVFISSYEEGGGIKYFATMVRPSGQVDNFFTSGARAVEKARRGRDRVYAAGGGR